MEKFHQLRIEKVLTTFHIKEKTNCFQLDKLLMASGSVTDFENATLDAALDRYNRLSRGWNEEELKMQFISSIINIVDPNVIDTCKTFFERPLEGVINNYKLHVITDCMIASYDEGGNPQKPYFFLQEFKQKQLWGKTDPQGQMLAAMLLAQDKNADGKYLYGCFVKENNWRFTTLLGLDYCVSRQYDSTQKQDLLQIVFILRKLKELILARNSI
jgi:hypothetical protein